MFTFLFGLVIELLPLLALKTTPGSTVFSEICTTTCFTPNDLILGGIGAMVIGVILLAASGKGVRRGTSSTAVAVCAPFFILAGLALIFKPIPDCAVSVNFLILSACTSPVNFVFGVDPDVFLALMFAVLGTLVLILGSVKVKGASVTSRR